MSREALGGAARRARVGGLLACLLAVGAIAIPSAAEAGGYDVHACNAAIGGGANNAFYPVAAAGLAAFADCPAGQGIAARNGWDNGTSGFLDGAFMIFDAPPGNVVESIAYEMGIERHDCSWSVSLVAGGYDLQGTRVWGLAPGASCDSASTPGPTNFFPHRWSFAINAPRVRIEARCGAGTCPRNGIAAMRLRNVTVRVRDDIAPTLQSGRGALWTNPGWLSGSQPVGFDAADAAGVHATAIRVDGKEVAGKLIGCDATRPVPCPPGGMDTSLNTAAWGSDGAHGLELVATDGGGNVAAVQRTVRIDNTAPGAPRELTVAGGEGWRPANGFVIRWSNEPQTAAPIGGAEYELCRTGSDECVRGSRNGEGITSIDDLVVPAPGDYELRVWLRDAAGNKDQRLAAGPVHLRYDDASPQLSFEALRAEDPTQLVVRTSDRGSGVAGGQIEMRRRGAAAWALLPTAVDGDALVARLDDEHLGDGVFELRARAADHAGNERSTDRRADGSPAEVTLPLRLKTNLRAGVVRRSHGRTRLARVARVGYGRLVRVRGRLTSPEGNPLQGFEVQAFTQIRDRTAPPRLIATVRTSGTGRFSFLVRRGPSRTIRIRYAGAAQIRSATRRLVLNVLSRTSISPNRRSFVNGETVRFRGKLATGRVPPSGKLVELQVKTRGRWRTFATTRTGPRGGWRYAYRFDGTAGRVTYLFRARVPRESGYPFATGRSRAVKVKVRGL